MEAHQIQMTDTTFAEVFGDDAKSKGDDMIDDDLWSAKVKDT